MSRIKNNKAIKVLLILMMFITLLPTNIIKVHAAQEYNITIEDGEAEVDGVQVTKAEAGKIISIDADIYKGDQAFSHWEIVSGTPVMKGDKSDVFNYFIMPANDVVIKAVYEQGYSIKMEGGCGHIHPYNNSYYTSVREERSVANRKIKINYTTDNADKEFSHWEVLSGGITLGAGKYVSFIMPPNDVVIKCVEKDYVEEGHNITIENGYAIDDRTKREVKKSLPLRTIVIYPNEAPEGMVFDYWEAVSGITLKYPEKSEISFVMPDNDVDLKVHYTKGYEVTVYFGDSKKTALMKAGKTVSLSANPTFEGKVFSHWEVVSGEIVFDDANSLDTTFIMPKNDVELKAVYVYGEKHSINVENGHAYVGGDVSTESYPEENVRIIAIPSSGGQAFSHWEVVSGGITLNDSKSAETYFTMPDNDVSIKAVFKKLYNIEVEGGVSYVDGSDTTSVISGKKVDIIVETVPEGQAFSHWEVVSGSVTLDDSNSRTTFFTMPEEDVVVKAIFEKGIGIEVKNGVAEIDGYKITHALENQNVDIFADIAPSGKKFAYWIVHEGGIVLYDSAFSPTGFVMGDKKVVVEAVYSDVYNVNILPTTNGSVVASKINDIISGTTINLTVTSDSGYELDELVVKDSANNVIPLVGTKFIMPASDVEVQATFKTPDPITFDLTTTVLGGHGSVSKGKTGLALNAMETVTFTPDANYEVDYVTVNGVIVMAVGNAYTVTMDSHKHVVVKYKKIGSPSTPQPTTFNLTTKVLSGKGDISQGKQDLALNSVETVTFTPEFGFEIDKVTVNGVEVSFIGNTYNVTMDSHKHVEVTYKDVRQTFSISYDLNGGTLQGKSGRVVILAKEGDTIKLPAAPYKPGYRFSYWKGSKYYPGDDYVVRDGHTFTAQWEKLAPTPINNSTMIVNPSNEVKYVNVKIPKTKDTTQTSLWLVVMMMSLVGLLGFNVLNKKQENK